jgi:hypothetical protein
VQKEKCAGIDKEKPHGEKRKLCKPLSLSSFTFDEIVDAALSTKPEKHADKGDQDAEGREAMEE